MNPEKQGDTSGKITHTTQIGSVTGQVHTGSGNINVASFAPGYSIATRKEFLEALGRLVGEIELARNAEMDDRIAQNALREVDAANREAETEGANADRIIDRLENAKRVIIAGGATATAATGVLEKLLPLIQSALEHVPKIFA